MEHPSRFLVAPALAVAAAVALPLAASAQTQQFYSPPKVLKFGTHTAPVAGSGSVTLKVFVKKNGAVGSVQVLKSTNHADDQAATEIAQTSTYKPGARDAKPEDAFYTLVLRFSGSSFAPDTGSRSSDVNAANALLQAQKYAEAKTELQSYLAAHPGDANAEALLGVAETFLNDPAAAAAAFDAAGTIPSRLTNVAAKAYSDAAIAALKANDAAHAVAYAQKFAGLQHNADAYYLEGQAYLAGKQYDKASASLEQASHAAQSAHAPAATQNTIDAALAQAYLLSGQQQKGLALAQDLKRRDPSNTHVDDAIAASYQQQAESAVAAGNRTQAVADLEAAAKAVPSHAALFYGQAANVLAGGAKAATDWKAVKAEAEKAVAAAPNDAGANYLAGVAAANAGDRNGALPYLQKAKANVGGDAKLGAQIDAALKALGQK